MIIHIVSLFILKINLKISKTSNKQIMAFAVAHSDAATPRRIFGRSIS